MASVLEGFLVRLGFEVNKDQQAKFKASLDTATTKVASLAKKGLAIGTAFTAGTMKAAQSINRLYNDARLNHTTIENMQTLGSAFEAVGGNASDAQAAIGNLSMKLKSLPHFDRYLKNQLGIDVYDKNGKAKDTVRIFMEIREALSKMDQGMARAQASALGLGGVFDQMMRKDFVSEFYKREKAFRSWGGSLSKTSEETHHLWNEIRLLGSQISTGFMVAVGEVSKETGLLKWLQEINKEFPKTASIVIEAEKAIMKESEGFLSWLGKWLFAADDYYLEAKKKRGGKLTEEEEKKLADFERRKKLDLGKLTSENESNVRTVVEDESPNANYDEDSEAGGAYMQAIPSSQVSPDSFAYSPVTGAGVSNIKNDNRQTITINQTNNIQTGASPKEVGSAVGNATDEAAKKIRVHMMKSNTGP